MMTKLTLVEFSAQTDLSKWQVVDDVVMGGISSGSFEINQDGHAVFKGAVSTENNGGFSSVQHDLEKTAVTAKSKIKLHLKGDGKRYQFRVKDASEHRYSYIKYFETNVSWETVEIELGTMSAQFRGRQVDVPQFNRDQIVQLSLLIANGRDESFELVVKKIELEKA